MMSNRLRLAFLGVITIGLAVYAVRVHVLALRAEPKCFPVLRALVQADPRFSKVHVVSPYGSKVVQAYGTVDSEAARLALEKLVLDTAGVSHPNGDGFDAIAVYIDVWAVEPSTQKR